MGVVINQSNNAGTPIDPQLIQYINQADLERTRDYAYYRNMLEGNLLQRELNNQLSLHRMLERMMELAYASGNDALAQDIWLQYSGIRQSNPFELASYSNPYIDLANVGVHSQLPQFGLQQQRQNALTNNQQNTGRQSGNQ
jgi:hypothetical protein